MTQTGKIGVTTENIFPVIKKFLYSDHEIFLRELVSNAVDASQKLRTLSSTGVYAVYVYVNGQKYKGILNIGHRPTLNNGADLSVEVHILDFEGDIYHQPMRIEFIDFLRTEAKFQSTEELALQIQKDKEAALLVL